MNLATKTFQGIIDSAASEFFRENTKNAQSVQRYADGAFNEYLSDDEARRVLTACILWKNYSGGEGQDYLYQLTSALEMKKRKVGRPRLCKGETVLVGLRIPASLQKTLQARADAAGVNLSEYIRSLIGG